MNLFKRDIKYQFRALRPQAIVLIVFYIIMGLASIFNHWDMGVIDYFLEVIMLDVGMVDSYQDFNMPYAWLILHLVPVIVSVVVISRDHYDNGIYIMIRSGSKRRYFFSKFMAAILWNMLIIAIFVLIFVILAFLDKTWDKMGFFLGFALSLGLENSSLVVLFSSLSLVFSTKISLFLFLLNMSSAMLTNNPYLLGQASLVHKQASFGGDFILSRNLLLIFAFLIGMGILLFLLLPKYSFYGDEK